MGLKYLEQVKSAILLLLIVMSLTLTFSIWTYSPSYETIDAPIVNIAIAEKRKMEDVVKPYRVIISQGDNLRGSNSSSIIDREMNSMKSWEVQTVELLNNQATASQINEYINGSNKMTFFYQAEVPIRTFASILMFGDTIYPDTSFNRLVVDWSKEAREGISLFFINTNTQKVYRAGVEKEDRNAFVERINSQVRTLPIYNEVENKGKLSLYVSASPEKLTRSTYYMEDIATERFKNALFSNPSLVRTNPLGTSGLEYTDDSALMKVDFQNRNLSYFHPASESSYSISPAELIQNSLGFVNEHDGWTNDYRYTRMNPTNQQVIYQLHYAGLPVFSYDTATEIVQYWGANRVYRYNRPYYTLNSLPINKEVVLPSGQEIYNLLSVLPDVRISSINDIMPGYQLSRNTNQPLVTLEPTWYYSLNGTWIRISDEILGGGKSGLE